MPDIMRCCCNCWAAADRTVDRTHEQILEHLGVVGIDRLGLDRDLDDLERAGGLDRDRAAAGGVLDELRLQLLLSDLHLLLHLAELGHHLLGIDLRHRFGSSISRASNVCFTWVRNSSSDRVGWCSASSLVRGLRLGIV